MHEDETQIQRYADFSMISRALVDSGWQVDVKNNQFCMRTSSKPNAKASYSGPTFIIYLSYQAEQRFLILELIERVGTHVVSLRLFPRVEIQQILTEIIKFQNNLDSENYPELVKSLITLCDPLLIDTDEGLFKLSK